MLKIIIFILLLSSAANAALTVNNVPRVKTGGTTPTLQNSSITDNGNVGINSTTPSQTLDVNGTIKGTTLVSGSGAGTITGDANGNIGIGTSQPLSLLDINSKFNVTSGGNVGIGTTTPISKFQIVGAGNVGINSTNPGVTLDVGGSIRASGDVTAVNIKATSGTPYVCIDTTGKLVKSASACSGT